MKKLLFVYNPVSGKRLIEENLDMILAKMAELGYEPTTFATSAPGDATEVIRDKGQEFDRVVVAGGDGTLQEAVDGVIGTDILLGYIPAGSTNDFAASIGIKGTLEEKVEIALGEETCRCDVGCLNGRTFNYVGCFGTLSDISYTASQQLKNKIGHVAYILKGIQMFHGFDKLQLTVEHDGQVITGEFSYGMITNSKYTAGVRLNYAKDVKLDDGIFEVILIRHPKGPIQLGKVANEMIIPHEHNDMVVAFQTSKMHIHCDTEIPWDLDGEYGGTYNDVDFSIRNKAVQIACRHREESELIKAVEQHMKSQFQKYVIDPQTNTDTDVQEVAQTAAEETVAEAVQETPAQDAES